MLKLLSIAAAVLVTGCASRYAPEEPPAPVYKLKHYAGPEAMTPNEVMQHSKECILNKMRPNVHYLAVSTDYGKAQVPISVICNPY